MTGIFYENGEIVGTDSGTTIEEIEFLEARGFNGEAHELAAMHASQPDEDPRVSAVRLTLQFIHDSPNGHLAVHAIGFISGCFPMKSQSEIIRKIRVSHGLWRSTVQRFKKNLVEIIGPELSSPAILRAIAGTVAEIGECSQPKLAALQLATACGLDLRDGESSTRIANSFGTSKQAFQQGKMRFSDRLGLSKTRAERKRSAKFSANNYRHPKRHEHTARPHKN